MTLPQSLQDKVKAEAEKLYLNNTEHGQAAIQGFRAASLFMYTLLQSQLEEKEKEVERLKGLLRIVQENWHAQFYKRTTTLTDRQIGSQFDVRWQEFKTEHNL